MENIIDKNWEDDKSEVVFYKPSLLLRVKSTLIDSSVVIILWFVCAILFNSIEVSDTVRMGAMMLTILYEPIFVAFGNTLGQKFMGLRVIKSTNYKESGTKLSINIVSSIFRYFLKISLGWISLLIIHSDDYGQAIHDKLAKSIMIRI